MADKKKQLSNVAFGGNWSEEILLIGELNAVLSVIDRAARECTDRDVEDEALHGALLYVSKNIEKGPMLVAAYIKGLRLTDQEMRRAEVMRVAGQIRVWAGL